MAKKPAKPPGVVFILFTPTKYYNERMFEHLLADTPGDFQVILTHRWATEDARRFLFPSSGEAARDIPARDMKQFEELRSLFLTRYERKIIVDEAIKGSYPTSHVENYLVLDGPHNHKDADLVREQIKAVLPHHTVKNIFLLSADADHLDDGAPTNFVRRLERGVQTESTVGDALPTLICDDKDNSYFLLVDKDSSNGAAALVAFIRQELRSASNIAWDGSCAEGPTTTLDLFSKHAVYQLGLYHNFAAVIQQPMWRDTADTSERAKDITYAQFTYWSLMAASGLIRKLFPAVMRKTPTESLKRLMSKPGGDRFIINVVSAFETASNFKDIHDIKALKSSDAGKKEISRLHRVFDAVFAKVLVRRVCESIVRRRVIESSGGFALFAGKSLIGYPAQMTKAFDIDQLEAHFASLPPLKLPSNLNGMTWVAEEIISHYTLKLIASQHQGVPVSFDEREVDAAMWDGIDDGFTGYFLSRPPVPPGILSKLPFFVEGKEDTGFLAPWLQ